MFIRFEVEELEAGQTTDTGPFNDRDELYFAVTGTTDKAQIERPRVSPPPPEDYYGLSQGQTARNIRLWEGFLQEAGSAFLVAVLREQDNAQRDFIINLVKGAALGIATIFASPSLGPAALEALKDAADSFIDSLASDGDQTIGALAVHANATNQQLNVSWINRQGTTTVNAQDGQATLLAEGSDARYRIAVRLIKLPLPMVVAAHSGKCLDVAGGDTEDQANIQQFTTHGGDNQRWHQTLVGMSSGSPVSNGLFPVVVLRAAHSGKALDVAGASKTTAPTFNSMSPILDQISNGCSCQYPKARWPYLIATVAKCSMLKQCLKQIRSTFNNTHGMAGTINSGH
jgi:Ricin-type beta-trefoil lectin domain-like